MRESTAIALIALVGIIMMACIAYFSIRVMINTTKYANRHNDDNNK